MQLRVQDRLSMLSDVCRDEFDFAWQRPVPQFSDNEDVGDILQQIATAVSTIDTQHYSRDTLSAAVGTVIQTGGYTYGRCMKVLRRAVCGPKVCTGKHSVAQTFLWSHLSCFLLVLTKTQK